MKYSECPALFFISLVPPARIKQNLLQKSVVWKGKCCWTYPGCHAAFFPPLFRRHIKTMWHFKMLHIWLVLSPEHMHCLRLTKTLLSPYFYLVIYRQHWSVWANRHCYQIELKNCNAFIGTVRTERKYISKPRLSCFTLCFFFYFL